jgi:hypothetical protein
LYQASRNRGIEEAVQNVTRVTVTEAGRVEVKLVPRRYDSRRELNKATRAYVDISHVDLGLEQPAFSIRDEDAALDAAWRRYNRAEVVAMKRVLAAAQPTLVELLGEAVTGCEWAFSRKAGCSCPCSPGLVDRAGIALRHGGHKVDVHLSVLPAPTQLTDHELLIGIATVAAELGSDEPATNADARSQALNDEGARRWGTDAMDDLAEQVTALRMTDDEFVTWARRESASWLSARI